MRVTPDIVRHEFIGTKATVAESTNPHVKGLSGRVVNETRNTFTFLKDDERRVVVKNSSVFHFCFPDGEVVEIDGKLLIGRPEDRLKKSIRRLW